MPNLLRPPNLPSLSGPTSIIIPHGPPRAGKVLFFLLLIGVGALFLYSAITSPTPTTADAPTLRISATPTLPSITTPQVSDYVLGQPERVVLQATADAVELELSRLQTRINQAAEGELAQLLNERQRLQNMQLALQLTREALDIAADARTAELNASLLQSAAGSDARSTAISQQATAESGQIQRQHERAAAQLAQAKADTAAAQAATMAAVGQVITALAIAIGASLALAILAALTIVIFTHGKAAWMEASAALPPTAAALPQPRPTTTTDDEAAEAFARLLDEMNREAEAQRRPPTPHRTPTAAPPLRPSPPVTDVSVTVTDAITDENQPLLDIKPADQYTEAEKRLILETYHRQRSRPTPTAQQLFGDASGPRNDLIRAIVQEFANGGD